MNNMIPMTGYIVNESAYRNVVWTWQKFLGKPACIAVFHDERFPSDEMFPIFIHPVSEYVDSSIDASGLFDVYVFDNTGEPVLVVPYLRIDPSDLDIMLREAVYPYSDEPDYEEVIESIEFLTPEEYLSGPSDTMMAV